MRVSAIREIDFKQTAQPLKPMVGETVTNDREEPNPKLPERVSLWKRVWYALRENDKEYDIKTQQLDYVV